MATCRTIDRSKALDAFLTTKIQIDGMPERLKTRIYDHFITHPEEIGLGDVGTLIHLVSLLHKIADSA